MFKILFDVPKLLASILYIFLSILQVYVYDPELKGDEKGCCVRVRSIAEEFPPLDGEEPLPPNLDSVYYSYKDQAMYFFKDEEVWKNELFHPKQKQIRNGIKKIGNWYDKWFDICDVRNMAEGHIAMEQTVATNSDARQETKEEKRNCFAYVQ